MSLMDPEYAQPLRKKLQALVSYNVEGLAKGDFYENGVFSAPKFERQRGVIAGLGLALDLLEPISQPPAEAETSHEQDPA